MPDGFPGVLAAAAAQGRQARRHLGFTTPVETNQHDNSCKPLRCSLPIKSISLWQLDDWAVATSSQINLVDNRKRHRQTSSWPVAMKPYKTETVVDDEGPTIAEAFSSRWWLTCLASGPYLVLEACCFSCLMVSFVVVELCPGVFWEFPKKAGDLIRTRKQ